MERLKRLLIQATCGPTCDKGTSDSGIQRDNTHAKAPGSPCTHKQNLSVGNDSTA